MASDCIDCRAVKDAGYRGKVTGWFKDAEGKHHNHFAQAAKSNTPQPEQPQRLLDHPALALTAEDKAVAKAMGVSEDDIRRQKARDIITEGA